MAAARPPFQRFHEHFEVADNGCWNWTGQTGSSGYGQLKVFGAMVSAHRFALELYKGPIPEGQWALHSCDNKLCVNPDHLRAGTKAENLQEAVTRGRIRRGSNHPMFGRRVERPRQAKPVRVLGVEYASQNAAERELGLGSGTVRYWINNHPQKASLIQKGGSSC